nr:hypothetical protein [Pseudomonas sp. CFBP 8772]
MSGLDVRNEGQLTPYSGRTRVHSQPLTPREVYQVLRDIALGQQVMQRLGNLGWTQTQTGLMTVEANGWVLTFSNDSNKLDYCNSCYSPDGREYTFDSSQRFGTDPLELLSTWEHGQLQRLLSSL